MCAAQGPCESRELLTWEAGNHRVGVTLQLCVNAPGCSGRWINRKSCKGVAGGVGVMGGSGSEEIHLDRMPRPCVAETCIGPGWGSVCADVLPLCPRDARLVSHVPKAPIPACSCSSVGGCRSGVAHVHAGC